MSTPADRLSASLATRYRVDRELGAGGMATVYLALDLKHEREVAIKVLHPDLGAALGGERFLTEIKTTARLQHPHILPLLDSGEADGLLYYVMPFVRGETLRARLERERQLPVADAVRIAREVANALEHAHRQGIIHRDIKPENILLQDGAALVADFGIALAVQSAGTQRLTQTGLSLGTPQYMSPEQAMGEKAIDARSDIYALAAVTYEMLTGDPPFTGSTVQAVVAKVISADAERPSLLRKTIPAAVETAVLTGLAKLPADRFGSASDFAVALSASVSGGMTSAPAAVSTPRASHRTARTVWTAAGMLMLGLLTGWGLWGRHATALPPTGSGDLTRVQATFTGTAGAPALSPNGDVLAYIERRCVQPGHDGHQTYFAMGVDATPCRDNLMVQDTGVSTAIRILRAVPQLTDVHFTAGATSLIVAGRLDSLSSGTYVIPRLGGTPRRIAESGLLAVHATADSVLVLPGTIQFGSARVARVVALASGQVTDSVRMPSDMVTGVAWSPDGRIVAATNSRGRLYLVHRGTGATDSLVVTTRSRVRWRPDGEALLFYQPAAGRDDDFMRVAVTSDGRFDGAPVPIAPRSQMIYRGDFDVARRSGLIALVTGSSSADIHSFDIGASGTSRQVTNGTSWYGLPNIAPDGRSVYYLRGNGNGDNLFRVRLDSADAEEEAITTGSGAGVSMFSVVSPDGRRLVFQRADGDQPVRTYDVDVQSRSTTPRAIATDGTWRPGLQPFGERGVVGLSADLTAILVSRGNDDAVQRIALPDSMRAMAIVLSPDAAQVALVIRTPSEALFGVTPIDRWAFRVLQRTAGAPINTALSWRADGFLYFGDWDATRNAPVLRRLNTAASAEGRAETVMTLPPRCSVFTAVVATAAPRGACVVDDFRGDVYLWRLDGVTR